MALYRGTGTTDTSSGLGATQTTEEQTATAGQSVFTLTTMSYTAGEGNLHIFVNGLKKRPSEYVENDNGINVTFTPALSNGDSVEFVSGEIISTTDGSNASTISYTFDNANAGVTTVEDKLQESFSVMDFGATGGGVIDDTTAFTNALLE